MKKEKRKDVVINSKKLDLVEDLTLSTCSNCDCTGLIPTAIKNKNEADAYEQLYPYITISIENNEQ